METIIVETIIVVWKLFVYGNHHDLFSICCSTETLFLFLTMLSNKSLSYFSGGWSLNLENHTYLNKVLLR